MPDRYISSDGSDPMPGHSSATKTNAKGAKYAKTAKGNCRFSFSLAFLAILSSILVRARRLGYSGTD
jgi:hypothetical protein